MMLAIILQAKPKSGIILSRQAGHRSARKYKASGLS